MIAGLLFGAAACGSSGGSDSKSSDNSSSESSNDEGSESGSANKAVQEYCDAVDDFVKKYKDAKPEDMSTMTEDSQELTEKATALSTAGLDADDAQAVADCTKKSTDALTPG